MKLLAANNINIEGALEGTNFAQAGGYTIPNIITTGINLLLIAAGVGAFIFLLWGALDWILSGGAKEGAENARKKITGSIVGLAIVFSVYVLQSIVGIVFLGDGNAIFNFKIPTLEKISVPPAPILPDRPAIPVNSRTTPVNSRTTTECPSISGSSKAFAGDYSFGPAGSATVCYVCLGANIGCGSGNPKGFKYPYWCPVSALGEPESKCK
ncbi:hypothetical protein HZB69_00715 [Candidatus Amesbacteria bacterium]|nr:hypothetical protein [Candidatus Amesbacteria bacterium]